MLINVSFRAASWFRRTEKNQDSFGWTSDKRENQDSFGWASQERKNPKIRSGRLPKNGKPKESVSILSALGLGYADMA
ncbi:hypothetical protein RIR_jg17325.t1 [Rhizophagus irregularis DAOM 181602=DAOM 197198]|nr:hypothetical protein RIR_jg17325.t1 [Rhizophagus irregularis DAOM 181602=DAOM 197198]